MYIIEDNVLVLVQEDHGEETTETGGHAEEPSGTDLLLPAPAELIFGAIAFLLVFTVLKTKAFPKIKEAMAEREAAVRNSLEAAETAKIEAEREAQQYRAQIGDARSEANRIVEDARGQAEQVRRELIAKAEKEAQAIVARAQEQIGAERDRTIQELQTTIGRMSVELAERVVGRSIDAAAQKDLVDSYIREVAGMSNGGGRA